MVRGACLESTLLLLFAAACSGPSDDVVVDRSVPSPEIAWVEVPAEDYTIAGQALRSSPARLFYDLVPGRRAGRARPLLVVTSGGPGAAVLFPLGLGLGPSVIRRGDGGPAFVERNPDCLADLGDLLFVDARGSGLSFLLSPTPDRADARIAEFSPGSFNVLRDAGDVLWVLLDVLDRHPDLGQGGLYFVAESYGGLRTTAMVDRLLYAGQNPTVPPSAALPDLDARIAKRPDVARRLRGQVLLEPSVAVARQHAAAGALFSASGSVLDRIALETGVPFVRCDAAQPSCDPYANAMVYLSTVGRSPYDYAATADWLDRHLSLVQAAGTGAATLAALLGTGDAALVQLLSGRTEKAFRFGDVEPETLRDNGELASRVGPLPEWDAYFSALVQAVLAAVSAEQGVPLGAARSSDAFGAWFIDHARTVPTFVSRATRDLNSYGPALAPVLASYTDRVRSTREVATGIEIEYLDGLRVTITSPVYEGSHAVLEDAAAAVHADLLRFVGAQ